MRGRVRERGFAIVGALFVFLLFLLVATLALDRLQREIVAVEHQKQRVRALDLAESGFAYAAHLLATGEDLPEEPLRFGPAEVRIDGEEDPPGQWRLRVTARVHSPILKPQVAQVDARGRLAVGAFHLQHWEVRRNRATIQLDRGEEEE